VYVTIRSYGFAIEDSIFPTNAHEMKTISTWNVERCNRIYLFIIAWASCFNLLLGRNRYRGRCWAAIWLSRHPEPSGHARCTPWGDRCIRQWRTTYSTASSSAPHWQAAEGNIPHLCKQEPKRPTPVRWRLSRKDVLSRAIPGGWVPMSGI